MNNRTDLLLVMIACHLDVSALSWHFTVAQLITFDNFVHLTHQVDMIEQFKGISEAEYDQLKDAVSLITVLIAGADGSIDRKEKDWAEKVTNIRSYSLPQGLKDFYLEVGEDFQKRLDTFIDQFSGEVEARNREISHELANLNPIFPKIEDRETAVGLYESFVSFARHVARASGGFLSWGTINVHEKKLMSLDMIHPVEE